MNSSKIKEQGGKAIFAGTAGICILAVIAIFVFIILQSIPALSKIGFTDFLFGTKWNPDANDIYANDLVGKYGILNMIVGTVFSIDRATLLGSGQRQPFWKIQLVTEPRKLGLTGVFQIPVEGRCQRYGVIPAQHHFTLSGVDFEDIFAALRIGRDHFELILFFVTGRHTANQRACSLDNRLIRR